ncbi:hypothetical protein LTR84_006349 [Exophiala bonariae]|uniref:Lysophospholipase n=1 Tax=Exophiala bonariae TaxID=1690606 RepID=A0AAV9N0Y8_9EURO|nr:hypothetical protein LTR84_006349 [Exophiala bonariae]
MRFILWTAIFVWRAHAIETIPDTYAPRFVDCPPDLEIVRQVAGLSKAEADWVRGRKAVAADAFGAYLERLNLSDFDVKNYTKWVQRNTAENMPTLGFANSGGGSRAAFSGIGGLRTFDSQLSAAVRQKTGGLLQSLTYYAGLSGGAWPPSSYAFHNYPAIDDLVAKWHVEINRFTATNDSEYAATSKTYFEEIYPKFEAGFNVSASDFFGRGFGYWMLPGEQGGLNLTWSSITELSKFKNYSGPFPILQANSLNKSSLVEEGLYAPLETSDIYEWNPFEFGSWDVGFTPTKYVGTVPDSQGKLQKCVVNLDSASFVMGSAAAAWNYWWIAIASNGTLGNFAKRGVSAATLNKRQSGYSLETLEGLNEAFNQTFNLSLSQIANPSVPNPFGGDENITLADGSEAGQSIPFWSLIQRERKLDLIIAWDDDGGETRPNYWTNGTNVWNTYNLAKAAGLAFPQAPPPETFLARNYALKPVLFGCNSSLTTTGDSTSPIVLHLTNAPYSWYSNFSWPTQNMSWTEFHGVMVNSFDFVTQGNGTLDSEWVQCIGCAAIDRSLERMGTKRTEQCERCFANHCWDGTTSELSKDFVLDPSLQLNLSLGFVEWNKTHPFSGGVITD